MTLVAALLVLASAFVHASWNLIGRRARPAATYYLVSSLVGATVTAPFVLVWWSTMLRMPATTWLLLPLAGLFQALYFIGLAGAYRAGDMAVAYPVARALPVLLVPAVSALLGQGEPVRAIGLLGMIAVTAGILTLPQPSFRRFAWASFRERWLPYALLAGVGTTGYSIVDDAALSAFRAAVADGSAPVRAPLIYAMFESFSSAVALAILALVVSGPRRAITELRKTPLGGAVTSGVGIIAAYALVLVAYGFARNVSYVVAFRQISLPVGVFMAMAILREPVTGPRIAGTVVLLAGLVLVSLG